jgi:tetratricopeptide (TPR) repeat protein
MEEQGVYPAWRAFRHFMISLSNNFPAIPSFRPVPVDFLGPKLFLINHKRMNYHYERIRLNQAIIAIQLGNKTRGELLLAESEEKIRKWNELQGSLALAYLLLHEESKAISVIRDALNQNPEWKENLPAFYLLKDAPGMEGLIDEKNFSENDWISAASFLMELDRAAEAAVICQKALYQFPASSGLHYLLGKSLHAEGKRALAKRELEMAVDLNPRNEEATGFLQHSFR